jgi:anti-sigma factor RsiW
MSPTDDHTELQEMLPAAALEILNSQETEAVLAHIALCEQCTALLEEYRNAAAALSFAAPRRLLDPLRARAMRSRLLTRARTEGPAPLTSSRKASSMIYQWSGWMVAAGITGVLLIHHSVHRPLDYGWLAAGILLMALLAVGIYAWVQRNRVVELEQGSERN